MCYTVKGDDGDCNKGLDLVSSISRAGGPSLFLVPQTRAYNRSTLPAVLLRADDRGDPGSGRETV